MFPDVFSRMTQSLGIQRQHRTGTVVRGPRPTDAIGQALRGAYDCHALPADMLAALQAMDRPHSRH